MIKSLLITINKTDRTMLGQSEHLNINSNMWLLNVTLRNLVVILQTFVRKE